MPDSRDTYLSNPRKGLLSDYGRVPKRRRDMDGKLEPLGADAPGGGKHAGTGDSGAPQVYVRMMVEFSYDKPRPDPDNALRAECGSAIRREVEKALTGDLLAAKLGDARVTLRAMITRQEDSMEAFGPPVSVTAEAGRTSVQFSTEGTPEAQVATVPAPTAEQAQPGIRTSRVRERDGRFVAVEDDEGTAPNAGSAG